MSIADPLAAPLAPAAGRLLGASPAIQAVRAAIARYGPSDATVLVHGETGTGKELIAAELHAASTRRAGPLVAVDGADAALPRAFDEAAGGTLFLDEVADLSRDLQASLVHLLARRDVRVIAATQRELPAEIAARRFRAELFYRLDVLRLAVPPLRERAGDVALLAAHFWRAHRDDEIAATLVAELVAQPWPGNVRELRNAVARAALVDPPGAPVAFARAKEDAVRAWERAWLESLLEAHAHNLSRAARAARMARNYLRQLCRRHGLPAGAAHASPGTPNGSRSVLLQ